VVFVLSLTVWKPYWQTNDDIAMSMVAHGYGLAAYPSSGLVFSNVIYGWIVRHTPELFDVFPYSVVSLALLFAAAWGIVYFVADRIGSRSLAVMIAALVFVPAVVFPQFSILAGLLACTGIAGFVHYAHRGGRSALVLSAVFLLLGFLVREQQFYLIVVVAAPFLPYRAILRDRKLQVALAMTVCIAASAKLVDYTYYRQPDWDEYRKLNLLRAAFTDYGGARYFRTRPELLAAGGFTANDIELIARWFFADDKIADPTRLSALLAKVRVADWTLGNLSNVGHAFSALADRNVLPLATVVILIFALVPAARKRASISCAVFCLAIGFIGALGRPGLVRVYYPVVGSLLVLTSMAGDIRGIRKGILAGAAIGAIGFAVATTQATNGAMIRNEARMVEDFARLEKGRLYVVWGAALDYEVAYPVLVSAARARNYRWFPLGAFSPAPFARARWREEGGKGLMDRLLDGSSLPIIANDELMTLLGRLMEEHYGRRLVIRESRQLNTFRLYEVSTARHDRAWSRIPPVVPSRMETSPPSASEIHCAW
jgi:hypothetical protein